MDDSNGQADEQTTRIIKPVPEPVRKIVRAMVDRVLARCEQLGIPIDAFYRAMVEEQRIRSTGDVADLFERTLRRAQGPSN